MVEMVAPTRPTRVPMAVRRMTSVLPVIRIQLEMMMEAAARPRNSRVRIPHLRCSVRLDIGPSFLGSSLVPLQATCALLGSAA